MGTKMHRVVLYVLDLNGIENTPRSLKEAFENLRHPEFVHVGSIKTTDIGEFHDDHPLNKAGGDHESYFQSKLGPSWEEQSAVCRHDLPLRYWCDKCSDEALQG